MVAVPLFGSMAKGRRCREAVVVVVGVVEVGDLVAVPVGRDVGRRAGFGAVVDLVGVREAVAVLVQRRAVRAGAGLPPEPP